MSRYGKATGLILAVIMLLSCMPSAFALKTGAAVPAAAQAQEETQQQVKQADETHEIRDLKCEPVKAVPQKGDVVYDQLWQITLDEALNPIDALHPVGFIQTSEWAPARTEGIERAVGAVPIPARLPPKPLQPRRTTASM